MTLDGERAALVDAVRSRLHGVHERIRRAGGDPQRVTVVAVTKAFGPEMAQAAVDAGLTDLGENYAQELEAKHELVPQARWHFLGHIQRNKVRHVAPFVHLWQSVDRIEAGAEIVHRSPGAHVLVQINISQEAAKNGCRFEDAPVLVEQLVALGLDVRGLMAVGPLGEPELARPGFRRIVQLADRLGLPERSLGMTDDLEVAVQEGSTMVRIGRALFGPRPGAGERQQ